ncbi:MAG TPA: RIP metalloprotease RseP [Bacteroidota bacterium]|nr:RIP metalloprotease RseP [Bacteroidota bacterium]
MEIVSTVFYFALSIGVLVFIHEFGHFLAAKIFGMRVDRFSIGFPPRAFGKKIGETDYCVSWIPVGGYVKIAGMVDESFDTEFVSAEPQPWEFRSKPMWQRMVVISAGVVMNVLLAVGIFWGITYHEGRLVRPVTEVGYVTAGSAAEKAGLRRGDLVLAVNKQPVRYWEDIESAVYAENIGRDLVLDVRRGADAISLTVPRSLIPDFTEDRFGIYPSGLIAVIANVESGKPAQKIGLMAGDTVVAVNDRPVSYAELPAVIHANAEKEIRLRWKRGMDEMSARVTPTAEGRIGVGLGAVYVGPTLHIQYSMFEALPVSFGEAWITTTMFVANLHQIATGKTSIAKSVGGPIKIAQMANRSAEGGAASFLGFMGLLSMSLALLNILPFPALDGGHLLFLTYEALFKREIPHKVKLAIQQAGVFLLLVFMAFVIYNDIASF